MAGCTPAAYREHCKRVFELPAAAPPEIIPNPNPTRLAFSPDCICEVLNTSYKSNKASGPSHVPTQVIKHLHVRNDSTLSRLFHKVTREGIPDSWNSARLTPVYKKGDKAAAADYRPVSVLGPLAKLFAACLNGVLERQATANNWHAPT